MAHARVVVMGASKGGVTALTQIARQLPRDFPVPICVVLHVGAHRSILPKILSDKGSLPAIHPADRQELEGGCIFVAPPDQHMRVEGGVVRLVRGPKEHHTRPAIDPLFRSAALSYGERAIGVVLTGLLNDGTPGMQAIKEHGGVCIVQDPEEAEEPSMPLSVMNHVDVDHRARLDAIPPLLAALVTQTATKAETMSTSDRATHEEQLFLGAGDALAHLRAIGGPSTFVCPDCRGALWQLSGTRPLRFRCHTGHAFTLETLRHAQSMATDEALWGAVRAVQEEKMLLQAQIDACRADGDDAQAARLAAQVRELGARVQSLRQLVKLDATED